MDKGAAAERILRLAVSRERASEVVGDLLESRTGAVRLWLKVAWLLVVFSWRAVLPLASAPIFAALIASRVSRQVFMLNLQKSYAAGKIVHTGWEHVPGTIFFLWSFTLFVLMRYGVGRLTQTALFATTLASITVYLFPLQHGTPILMSLAILVSAYCTIIKVGWKCLGVMSASMITTSGPCFVIIAVDEHFGGGQLTPLILACIIFMPVLQGLSTQYFYSRWLAAGRVQVQGR